MSGFRRRLLQKNKQGQQLTHMYVLAKEDGLTVSFSKDNLEYSLDGNNWNTLARNTYTPAVDTGTKIYFKAVNPHVSGSGGMGSFTITKKCGVGGCICSLTNGDNYKDSSVVIPDYAFYNLFKSCSNIEDANELILNIDNFSSYCFGSMFYNCTNLVNTPKLPATNLSQGCYISMFYGCTNLVNTPELPATILAYACYNRMFGSCKNLVNAPELPATILADYCYCQMFLGCSSLTEAPALPATTLAKNCYQSMFSNCANLITAPELPATTLADYCYSNMFDTCRNLVNAPELPATTLAYYCYQSMFMDCSKLRIAPKLSAPYLNKGCYSSMFYDCQILNSIIMTATDISGADSLKDWVYNVYTTGTFVKASSMTSLPTGSSGIPEGWTVENV